MLFPKGELPTATLLPRQPRERLAAETRRWAARQWGWLAPRTLPMIVAVVGLVCVVASGRYLSRLATQAPPASDRTALFDEVNERPTIRVVVRQDELIDVDVPLVDEAQIAPAR